MGSDEADAGWGDEVVQDMRGHGSVVTLMATHARSGVGSRPGRVMHGSNQLDGTQQKNAGQGSSNENSRESIARGWPAKKLSGMAQLQHKQDGMKRLFRIGDRESGPAQASEYSAQRSE